MPSFSYTARTPEGELQHGVVEAGSREAAIATLLRHGLIITELSQVTQKGMVERRMQIFAGVSKKDVMIFSRQLSVMLDAQVPLLDALHALRQQAHPALARVLNDIAADVDSGSPLSAALAQHHKVFSEFFVNIVRSGEASGKLVEVLGYLADHIEREYAVLAKIRGAMLYPSLVLLVAAGVSYILVFGIPGVPDSSPVQAIEKIFEESGAKLPFLTRALIGTTSFVRKNVLLLLFGLVAAGFVLTNLFRKGEAKAWWEAQMLKLPVFGKVFQQFYIARMAGNLATLITAGIPIADALTITAAVVGNFVYRSVLLSARDGVRRGEALHPFFSGHWALPAMVPQMVSVGERTGNLVKVLSHLAQFFRQETDRAVDNLTTLLEPMIIVLLGLVVAGIVASVILPMYNLVTITQ